MKTKFQKYWQNEILPYLQGKQIYLACSGGVDSVVLFYLLKEHHISFEVLHVNYQLRGDDSDSDENFVSQLCVANNIVFHSKKVDTQAIKKQEGGGIQEIAREIRYQWFQEFTSKNGAILTAHHLNDQIETVLFRLARGNGFSALDGISNRVKADIFRPLLTFSKEEIQQFAQDKKLAFSEDLSNAKNDYSRNKIRNLAIPIFKEIFPNLEIRFKESLEDIAQKKALLELQQEEWNHRFLAKEPFGFSIEKRTIGQNKLILSNFFFQFGFKDQHSLEKLPFLETGKKLLSTSFELIVGRQKYYLKNLSITEKNSFTICENELKATENEFQLPIESRILVEDLSIRLDKTKLVFPLEIRKRKSGDYFYPEKFHGKKKLKDFLNSLQMDIPQKDATWLLCDQEKILWVIGYRKDKRALANLKEGEILELKISKD
ncbi:MAG: tRNA lysidine(34) synthetase TilS [Flavobacteriales bacterium]|jgi:tRNA(Ile)-lysidine synthase|nr:tRNA lysidine(34) synthetase TilS [Flavobacteriales bacterium]